MWLDGVYLDSRSPMEAADRVESDPFSLLMQLTTRGLVVHSERFEEKMMENGGNVTTWYVEDRGHVDAIWGDSEEYKLKLLISLKRLYPRFFGEIKFIRRHRPFFSIIKRDAVVITRSSPESFSRSISHPGLWLIIICVVFSGILSTTERRVSKEGRYSLCSIDLGFQKIRPSFQYVPFQRATNRDIIRIPSPVQDFSGYSW